MFPYPVQPPRHSPLAHTRSSLHPALVRLPLARPRNSPRLVYWFANARTGGRDADTVGFFYYFTPILPDHTIMMNEVRFVLSVTYNATLSTLANARVQLNGGYIMQGPLRRSRWQAIDRALVELMRS